MSDFTPFELQTIFERELAAIPMLSIIEWYTWNDGNGEFNDLTFSDCVDIAVDWFDSVEDMAESRYNFLGDSE